MSVLRVMVVDDDESVRRLLGVALPLVRGDIEVVAEAIDGQNAVVVAAEARPDLIILDHMMPGRTGAEVVPELKKVSPDSEIIFFSAYLDSPEVGDMIREVSGTYNLETVPKGGLAALEESVTRAAERKAS